MDEDDLTDNQALENEQIQKSVESTGSESSSIQMLTISKKKQIKWEVLFYLCLFCIIFC